MAKDYKGIANLCFSFFVDKTKQYTMHSTCMIGTPKAKK
jgi:hypothetical protein